MGYLVVAVFVIALGFWSSAVVHAVWLLGHLAPGMSVSKVLFQGYRFYQRETFAPSGQPIHRRFVISALGFLLAVLVGIAVAAITASVSS